MIGGILKATRAHYAALQHKPGPDRIALDYEVTGAMPDIGTANGRLTAGTIWVKVLETTPGGATGYVYGRRQAELTKLQNRLRAMYPEASHIVCAYRK